jgi:hypothetical protein
MAFKMKYSPNKKTGAGFPFKRLDDKQTQMEINSAIEGALEQGATDKEIDQLVTDMGTDYATTYTFDRKSGKSRSMPREGAKFDSPSAGEIQGSMGNVYSRTRDEGGNVSYEDVGTSGGRTSHWDKKGKFVGTSEDFGDDSKVIPGTHEEGAETESKATGRKILKDEMIRARDEKLERDSMYDY